MAYCSVLGHCFYGMLAYLLDMDKQMEEKHSQQLSTSYLVACKSSFKMYFFSLILYELLKPLSVSSALGQAAPNLAAIAKGRAAAGNILSMIETDANSSDRSDSGILIPTISGKIEFCEVCFAYPSRPDMVFQNLSFAISSGKTFAVVGPSGSGKSTILSMVERFYEPTSGSQI